MTPAWPARAVVSLTCGALLFTLTGTAPGQTARAPSYEHAEHLREALDSRATASRTRLDYSRVIRAFRAIYQTDPGTAKADASVLAAATLLTEEGRLFNDAALLRSAINQFELLQVQYPNSNYRFSALLSEGEIYRRDLNDRDQAKQKFALFLTSYPENPLAEQARIQLNDILAEEHPVKGVRHLAMTPPAIQPQQVPVPPRPPPAMTPPAIAPTSIAQTQSTPLPDASPANLSLAAHPGRIAVVSDIRHWSTPVYTRIAIDLENQVAFQAARVPNPDRIYFDLYGARLEAGLNGKSVEVIDDGFLKRIRAAQFSNNVTRIVLDVSSVADYSAFLLPNPWRLIIDIHGLKPGTTATTNLASAVPPSAPAEETAKPAESEPDPSPATTAPVTPLPAAKVRQPARRSASVSTQEIASLGQQPGRIQATEHPTTRPIAASVAGTVPAPQADDGSLASTTPPPAPVSKKSGRHKSKNASVVTAAVTSPGETTTPGFASGDDSLASPMHEAEPTAVGERSLVRTLGLKIGRIVIDAGHGGHDSGTLGPGGIEEKQVVLDVALRVGKLLKQRLGADVIFTRDDDTFIPLETRTAIANKAQADLFLSIHANSSPDPSARGVETYYLNFTTSPDALEVAARENAVSDESIHELSGLVKKITLKDKIDESREFAADVQKSLYTDLEEGNPGLRDRGVKKAPFVVLIGANMPSILAEISFLTNTDDARELRQPAYRQRIAESLYRGVARYISGLSGVRLAQSSAPPKR
jgi:N-acetylmuramoyl-L-alanine amidase